MPKKSKKFIDKKSGTVFTLGCRDQHDPLIADDTAPQHVLVPVEETPAQKARRHEDQLKYGIYYEDDYDYLQHLRDVNELRPTELVTDQRLSLATLLGGPKGKPPVERVASPAVVMAPGPAAELIPVEKPPSEWRSKGKPAKEEIPERAPLMLPSIVFGSKEETKVGLLNKAVKLVGPQPDLDPDIVAALDDDFDFENEDNMLEDNFMELANAGAPSDEEPAGGADADWETEDEEDLEGKDSDADSMEARDEVGSLAEAGSNFGGAGEEEETRSRFTDYSMSSSVIRRNEGLTLLDDRFEKFYEQYDEEEMGDLEGEDMGGCIPPDSDRLKQILDEFERERNLPCLKDVVQKAVRPPTHASQSDARPPAAGDQSDCEDSSSSSSEEDMVVVETKPRISEDCESRLSNVSTLYNHPKTIPLPPKNKKAPVVDETIQLTKRVGIPAGVFPASKPTRRQVEAGEIVAEGLERPGRIPGSQRGKDETAEERRARKAAVKGERRARREEKSATQRAFRDEKLRQDKETLNVRMNLQAVRIL